MKKLILERFNSPLKMIEFQSKLGRNEVLIKNDLIGFNPVDYKICEGSNLISKKLEESLPWTPGYDVVGRVIEVGSNIQNFKVGDVVCGMTGFPLKGGAYATHSLVEGDEVVKVPSGVGNREALACCLSGLTAYQAFQYLKESDRPVLIIGATGAVGQTLMLLSQFFNKSCFATYRDEVGLLLLKKFKDVKPIAINELKTTFRGIKVDVIDLVGGELIVNMMNNFQSNINKLITVPTYSKDEVLSLAISLEIDCEHFIVEKSIFDLEKLLEISQVTKFKLDSYVEYSLDSTEEAFNGYNNRSFKGKMFLIP